MEHTQALEHLRHNPNLGPFERLILEIACNQLVIIGNLDQAHEDARIIISELAGIRRLQEKIMQDQAALDAKIQQVVTDFTASLSTSVQEIKDAIATKGGGDFTNEVTALGALDDQINALPGQVAAALAGTVTTDPGTGDTGTTKQL